MSELGAHGFECARARATLHRLADGEWLAGEPAAWLGEHLAACRDCDHFRADLEALQRALGALPLLELPPAALDRVWERTLRAGPSGASDRRPWLDWRALGAVALLGGAAWGLWQWRGSSPTERPGRFDARRIERDPAYALQVAGETRRVLRETARALDRTRQAAIRSVLVDEVSGALRQVPIHWPDAKPDQPRAGEET